MEKKTTASITRFGEVCFWAGLIIELLLVIIDKSAYINPYEGITFRLTFLMFCIKIATTKYTRREWLCILGVGIIAMISYFVNDKDDVNYNIKYSVDAKNASAIADVRIDGKNLIVTSKDIESSANITIYAESRGVVVEHTVNVVIDKANAIDGVTSVAKIYVEGNILKAEGLFGDIVYVYDMTGRNVDTVAITSERFSTCLNLPKGVYLVKTSNIIKKIIL